jgi:hypothetical protein
MFNGLCFFSFVPVLILLSREYGLTKRLVLLMVLLYLASSFSFRMAYSDKPEVIGFPAFLSFLVIGLLALKKLRTWHPIALGGLMAAVFNTKMVLITGTLGSFLILAVFYLTNRPNLVTQDIKRAALISMAIVIVAGSLVPIQNMILRGNPLHPFTAAMLGVSDRFREESEYTAVPRYYYGKTMPIQTPSRIAGINLDARRGMYRPFLKAVFSGFSVTYEPTRDSISVVITLCCVLAPLLLCFNPDRLMFACSSVMLTTFFLWFSWIGDRFRYSTAFPAMCLLTAVWLGGNRRFLSRFLVGWRSAAIGLLLASIPFALGATFEERTPADVLKFCLFAGAKPGVLKPLLHPVTGYLKDHASEKPVLLVADSRVPKYGLYQPSFFFQPYFYSHKTISMAYIAKIKPTHLLTTKILDESILAQKYPFLANYLVLDKSFETENEVWNLYRFKPEVQWDRYFNEFSDRERFSPALVREIESFMIRYRKLPALPDKAN